MAGYKTCSKGRLIQLYGVVGCLIILAVVSVIVTLGLGELRQLSFNQELNRVV